MDCGANPPFYPYRMSLPRCAYLATDLFKARGTMRNKAEPAGVKLLGKGHMENRKVKFRLGVVTCNMRKQVELRMSQNGTEARL